MSDKKNPKEQTVSVDEWECPWCGKLNDPRNISDLLMNEYAHCSDCGGEVLVMPSIEYTCRPTKNGEFLK